MKYTLELILFMYCPILVIRKRFTKQDITELFSFVDFLCCYSIIWSSNSYRSRYVHCPVPYQCRNCVESLKLFIEFAQTRKWKHASSCFGWYLTQVVYRMRAETFLRTIHQVFILYVCSIFCVVNVCGTKSVNIHYNLEPFIKILVLCIKIKSGIYVKPKYRSMVRRETLFECVMSLSFCWMKNVKINSTETARLIDVYLQYIPLLVVTGFPTWATILIGNIAALIYTTLVS